MDSLTIMVIALLCVTGIAIHLKSVIEQKEKDFSELRNLCSCLAASNKNLQIKNNRAQQEIRHLENMMMPSQRRQLLRGENNGRY